MPDAAVIERRGKAHAEAAEEQAQADAEAAEKVKVKVEKPKPEILDYAGAQLTFEGLEVEELDSRIVGDFKIELAYIRKGDYVRFEGVARLDEVISKTVRKGKTSTEVRGQKFYVEHVEAWRDSPGVGKPNEIDEKIAAFMAERHRLAAEDED